MSRDVVLLHGFAGTGRSWDAVLARLGAERYTDLAPDLRGHGASAARRPLTLEAAVADVLAAAPPAFTLAGYSLGGRVALLAALEAPERIERLVLISATAGIEDAGERAARRAGDAALADELETLPIALVADRWLSQPLFAGDPATVQARGREDIERNDPASLAAALRGMGTGTMAPVWDRLGELTMPAAVVVGERDAKFVGLGERLAAGLPSAELTVVPGAGHALPRERAGAVAAAIAGPSVSPP